MARTALPTETQKQVLVLSRRRCCICFGLKHDLDLKQGQIAHLDRNNTNNLLDNLAFLCLFHRDTYDSTTSQSKGFQATEVEHFRKLLYEKMAQENEPSTPSGTERDSQVVSEPSIKLVVAALVVLLLMNSLFWARGKSVDGRSVTS